MNQTKPKEAIETIGQMIVRAAKQEMLEEKTPVAVSFQEKFDRLNERRKRFVWEFVRTGVARQAAIAAGYTENRAEQAGYELMQSPDVSSCTQELLRVKFGANYVMAKFGTLAETAQGENIQLQATDRLARIAGLYNEPQDQNSGSHLHIHLPKLERKPVKVFDVDVKNEA